MELKSARSVAWKFSTQGFVEGLPFLGVVEMLEGVDVALIRESEALG